MAPWDDLSDKPSGLPEWACWCSQCDKMFASKITRRKHQRDCHYVCKHPSCGAYLYTEETFLGHIQEDHADVYCKLCDFFFESSRCLERHLEVWHSYCRKCNIIFSNDEARHEHYMNANPYSHSYCRTCQLDLPDGVSLAAHLNVGHAPPGANDNLPKHEKAKNNKRKHQNAKLSSDKEEEEEENMPGAPPNHYRTLGIHPSVSHKELLVLVKQRRCETHPDKFVKKDLTAAEMENVIATAKNVGWAADVLSDQTKRRQHDSVLKAWRLQRDERLQ